MIGDFGSSVIGFREETLRESYAEDPVIKRALSKFHSVTNGKYQKVLLEDYLLNHSIRKDEGVYSTIRTGGIINSLFYMYGYLERV
jgi:hypothetical protein